MTRPSSPYSTPIFQWRTPEEYDSDYWTEYCSMLSTIESDIGSVWASVSSHSADYWNSTQQTVSANSADWESAYDTVNANSADWEDVYDSVNTGSAGWGGGAVDTPVWSADEISFDSGWFRPFANTSATGRVAHGLGTEPDIAFLWARGTDYVAGDTIFTGLWCFNAGPWGMRIIEKNATNITIQGTDSQLTWIRSGKRTATTTCRTYGPEYRILTIDKTPNFNTGWLSLSAHTSGSQVTKAHGLTATPDIYTLELATTEDGTGNHGYEMVGNYGRSGGPRTTIVDVTAANFIFSIAPVHQYDFYNYNLVQQDYDTGVGAPLTGVWYRIQAWNWTPDYNSGWLSFDSTTPSRLLFHNLGTIPWLYFLEFSKASDGSNDVVPMMGLDVVGVLGYVEGDYGIHLQHLGHNTALVSYGHVGHYAAEYEDSDGNFQTLTSGFFRLKLWA